VFRYIALLWNSAQPPQASTAERLILRLRRDLPGWTQILSCKGIQVFVAGADRGPSRAYDLGEGVVLGTLFSRTDTAEERFSLALSAQQQANILRTHGHALIDSYWGRYVAFLYDARSDEKRVIRDPTGGMPCLWIDSNGVRIFCSWLEDALRLDPRPLSIDWDTIATRLATSLFHSERSSLQEVSELRAGECLCLRDAGCASSFYWNPIEIANRERIDAPMRAIGEIRRTTQMCVHAWASRHQSIIHYLSGGLDSAIVLAALQGAKRRVPVTALHYFSPEADGDERPYAYASAQRAGCPLVERQRNIDVDLREMLGVRRTAEPASSYVRIESGKHEAEWAAHTRSDGIFSGDGGDALFFRSTAASTAVDYVRDHGAALRSLGIAFNAAYQDDLSFWLVLRDMWRYGVRRRPLHRLVERSNWGALTAEVIESFQLRGDFVHPWFEHATATPPAKQAQAFLLSFAPDFYDPFRPESLPQRACPLLSQPLLELCLQIPTYVLAPGPQDRMLARKAFADALPGEILHRSSKGSLARHVKSVLHHNRLFLAELLLDGVLVRRQLLDRQKLANALSTTPTAEKCWAPELFDYAAIECWVRNWLPTATGQ
jgi:asparagine synthase (glutamine-hydrolysing)